MNASTQLKFRAETPSSIAPFIPNHSPPCPNRIASISEARSLRAETWGEEREFRLNGCITTSRINNLTLAFIFSLIIIFTLPLPASAQWQVGVGRATITPTEPIWMAGYASRTEPSKGVLTELWAKALLIEDASQNRVLLVTLDLVGIEKQLAAEICDTLQKQFNLTRSQISLSTSHTHSAPVVGKNLRPMHFYQLSAGHQKQILDYSNWLQGQILSAAKQAFESKQPSRVEWGCGTATFATNRRNNPEGETPARRTNGELVGPVDHSVPVLVAWDRNNDPIAIAFGYACHATVLSEYKISGDYPGFAQLELEKLYPGTVAMFWAGCGADQNPLPRRTEELAVHYGRHLASAVESVLLTHKLHPVAGSIEHRYAEIPLRFAEVPSRETWQALIESPNRYESIRAKLMLEELDAGREISSTYPYPVLTWKLGDDIEWIHLGGEVVVDYAARLKSERHNLRTWVAGYANDVMAYIPSLRVLREGGYEGGGAMVYYGLPSAWSEKVEEDIVAEVVRQLGNVD